MKAQVRLSECAVGRDNNFNLIRLAAALSVIFTHSVAVLGLPTEQEVFFDRLGLSLGDMAVDVFFVISGFLVTASLVNRRDLIAYLCARALRIYPALWVMLGLTVFVLAPLLTTLSPGNFFAASQTYAYVWKCATLIGGVRYSLPAVFEGLPLKGLFNASLWTLPIELRMYLVLAAAWLVLSFAPAIRERALVLGAPIAAAVLFFIIVRSQMLDLPYHSGDLRMFMFLFGSTLFLWRSKVPLSRGALAVILAAFVVSSVNRSAYFLVYCVGLAPLVMHLAYVPRGPARALSRLGDYSYGTYIYAFPIQQTLATVFPGMGLGAMFASSAVVTLAVAALSWHIVEKRALAMKNASAQATERLLHICVSRIAAIVR